MLFFGFYFLHKTSCIFPKYPLNFTTETPLSTRIFTLSFQNFFSCQESQIHRPYSLKNHLFFSTFSSLPIRILLPPHPQSNQTMKPSSTPYTPRAARY